MDRAPTRHPELTGSSTFTLSLGGKSNTADDSNDDLNRDNVVNVADVQKVINAALGLGCLY